MQQRRHSHGLMHRSLLSRAANTIKTSPAGKKINKTTLKKKCSYSAPWIEKSVREHIHLARLKNAAAKHYQTCRSQNSIKTQLEGPTAGTQFPERWYCYKLHYAPGRRFHTGPPRHKAKCMAGVETRRVENVTFSWHRGGKRKKN